MTQTLEKERIRRPPPAPRLLPSLEERRRLRRRRGIRDGASRVVVAIGGISVILALGLIFVYLFSQVVPLLRAPAMEPVAEYVAPGSGPATTLHVAMERYREVAVRFTSGGDVTFFAPQNGSILHTETLPLPGNVAVASGAAGEPRTRIVALGLTDGRALVVEHAYTITYPEDVRLVTPRVDFPVGPEAVEVDPEGRALTHLAVQRATAGGVAVAAVTEDGRLLFVRYEATTSFMTGEVTLNRVSVDVDRPDFAVTGLLISMDLRDLIVADEAGGLTYYAAFGPEAGRAIERRRVVAEGASVAAVEYLLGTASMIVGGSDGTVAQWMLVRDDENVRRLHRVRTFEPHGTSVTAISPAHARKGFVTADADGEVALHFSTSHRTLLRKRVAPGAIRLVAEGPRADGLFAVGSDERVRYYEVENEHPQVSLAALFGRVWYEGRQEPDFVWQSSSATDEFEPKFSLVPLTLGTVKAAFYAMLFAIPLALMGAIYTGYFMTPKMRGFVKPTIEVMEALPTVILGFLAGLWFAPFVENHLPAVFSVVLLLPPGMLLFGLTFHAVPRRLRNRIPEGWEAAMLIPVVLLIGWLSVTASPFIEIAFFDGSMRQWFTEMGITYDQRNALVVGVAMGFAVIPTIFSIAEDAIFNVPKHLSQGSLAMGATPWQTMARVVLLTASPGLFAAIMIGLGRAVGETMIVLMATGNSPIVNFNLFEGMRTLSANIAVEMPETEVGGTHYRIIFLSALLLFVLTFVFNTVAEVVRQRVRKKYSTV